MTDPLLNPAMSLLIENIGWSLVHSVWQATLGGLVLAIVLRGIGPSRAHARYVVLCLGLLIVSVMPVVTFALLSRLDSSGRQANVTAASARPSVTAVTSVEATQADTVDPLAGRSTEVLSSTARVSDGLPRRITSATPWIVAAWCIGVAMLSVWRLAGWLLAQRLVMRGTLRADARTQSMFEELMRRMKVPAGVRLMQSTRVALPIVVGWLRPVILLPVRLLCGLTPDQVQSILAHELSHVRRCDYLVNLLQGVAETGLFYHPAVWWMSRQIRIEREFCADADAVAACGNSDAYAMALVALADFGLGESAMASFNPAVAATGGSLTQRIHRVLGLRQQRDHLMRQPAWIVSAVVGLIVCCGWLNAPATDGADDAGNPEVNKPAGIKVVADRLVARTNWKLWECDEEPSVVVGNDRGYRIVLRRTWQTPKGPIPQQVRSPMVGPFEEHHEDWEFALFPLPHESTPAALKQSVKWRKSDSPYETRDVWLGEGLGYAWFTRGTLFGQGVLRQSLALQGGDDPIQLAVDGLQVEDEGTNTANSCVHIAASFGDDVIPYLERALQRPISKPGRWKTISCLGHLPTDRSTELLVALYDSPDTEIRRAAEYGLIQTPYRAAAKPAYLDMLKRKSSLQSAAAACVKSQWKEAVPLLQRLTAHPPDINSLSATIPARRTLEGQPIAADLLQARETLRSMMRVDAAPDWPQKVAAARRLVMETDDDEAANWIAVSLAAMTSKGGAAPVNKAGVEILQARPRRSTEPFLKSLRDSLEGSEREKITATADAVFNVQSGR
jgi:beta-lactamase regulating signal transducer with metallopeptidase domain